MVSIRAVRESTGRPIPYCEVSVWSGGAYRQTTNDQGVAVFASIDPGTYTVYVEGIEKKDVYLAGEVVIYI